MNNRKHYLAGVSAFLIWGFFSIPLRAIHDYFVGEILYFRILFSAMILIIIVAGFKRKSLLADWKKLWSLERVHRRQIIQLTVAGALLLIVNWLTFIYIVTNINVKSASFSYMICPVITAVLGAWLLKEKLTSMQWVAVSLCTVSCVLIGMSSALELGYSFLTAVSYAMYLVSQRKNQGFDRIIVLSIQMILCLLILSCFYPFLVHEIPSEFRFYGVISVIAGLFTVLALFLNLFALNRINSATIGILLYLNPMLNFILAIFVFHEHIDLLQGVGYLVILVALILFNLPVLSRLEGMRRQRA
ncbi:MAG: EamA family transporter [Chryseolinea sp.]